MSTDVPRSLDEVLEDFDDMTMDVLYSPPGEFRMEEQNHFDATNVPPEQLPCPDPDCDGTGISLVEPLGAFIQENQSQTAAGDTPNPDVGFSRIYECGGRKNRGGDNRERYHRLIKVIIKGTLK